MSSKRKMIASSSVSTTPKPVKQRKIASIFERAKYDFRWADETVGASNKPKTCLLGYSVPKAVLCRKLACFDLDGTLIQTKSKGPFPKDEEDFQPIFGEKTHSLLKSRFQALLKDGYSLVVISNQNVEGPKLDQLKMKVKLFLRQMDAPFHVLAALKKDYHRKPFPGMFDILREMVGQDIDLENSFYVGDAAGRPEAPSGSREDRPRAEDHSACDYKFALNVGLRFMTPEEYIDGSDPRWKRLTGFDASEYLSQPRSLVHPPNLAIVPRRREGAPLPPPELVLFVGPPASGKTTFYQTYFQPQGYVHVNQDTLKNRNKCVNLVREMLTEGKSCVVDNTNPEAATRALYLEICSKLGLRARCFFWSDVAVAWHNNLYRSFVEADKAGEQRRTLIPVLAFTSFRSHFQPPQESEGFEEVRHVSFVFSGTDDERSRWSMWLELGGRANASFEKAPR